MMGLVGTPIIAIESGYVEALGWNRYGGWRIGIRSFDKKRYYYYAHLRQNRPYAEGLKEGDYVTAGGDVIGYKMEEKIMAKKIVLAGACRTAIGTMGGSLSTTPAQELGAIVIKEALNRAGVPADKVDHVYMGCVIQAGLGQNVARQSSIKAGLPDRDTGSHSECRMRFRSELCQYGCTDDSWPGDADIVVAGGMENMSMAPSHFPMHVSAIE